MNDAYKSWGQKHEEFWEYKTQKEIKAIIDADPEDTRSTMCHHVKGAYCSDCNYKKGK